MGKVYIALIKSLCPNTRLDFSKLYSLKVSNNITGDVLGMCCIDDKKFLCVLLHALSYLPGSPTHAPISSSTNPQTLRKRKLGQLSSQCMSSHA